MSHVASRQEKIFSFLSRLPLGAVQVIPKGSRPEPAFNQSLTTNIDIYRVRGTLPPFLHVYSDNERFLHLNLIHTVVRSRSVRLIYMYGLYQNAIVHTNGHTEVSAGVHGKLSDKGEVSSAPNLSG